MVVPIGVIVEYTAKLANKKFGLKVASVKLSKIAVIGKLKVYTFKLILVGGKVTWVTLKVIGCSLLGASISQTLFGGG